MHFFLTSIIYLSAYETTFLLYCQVVSYTLNTYLDTYLDVVAIANYKQKPRLQKERLLKV